jgi:protein-tyrosine phosphatase
MEQMNKENTLYSNMDDAIVNILIDLDMFSRLGPNISVHLDRNEHFIITAKYLSNIIGVQTMANIIKSHSTKTLVTDLHNFTQKIINVLNDKLEIVKQNNNEEIKVQSIKLISIICREFKLAYTGLPDIKNGGMQGLMETLKNDPSILQLKNAISFMKESIESIKKTLDKLQLVQDDDIINCPEIHFTDDEWEEHMKIVPSLNTEYVGLYKYYINYSSILTLNQFEYINNKQNWWDKIIEFENGTSIYLGALPIIQSMGGYVEHFEKNHLIALQNLNIKAILSVVEIFENNSTGYIYSPVLPIEWRKANFKHYQIPSSDFCTMHMETLQKGVEFIHWNIKNNRSIYVHCKSGKSRSFLVVVSYLVKYLGYTAENALNYVKSKRIQAGFGKTSTKIDLLRKFEQVVNNK